MQASRSDFTRHLTGVLISAKRLSGYQEPSVISEPVFTGRIQREGYVIEKYFVKGEGDYIIPYLLMIPAKPNNKAMIYLHPSGKAAEVSVGGEMGPGDFKGDSFIDGNSYNIWYASILMGRSIVGIRAGDVVRLTRLWEKVRGISEG